MKEKAIQLQPWINFNYMQTGVCTCTGILGDSPHKTRVQDLLEKWSAETAPVDIWGSK